MNKLSQKIPLLKKSKLSKKAQENEDQIKRNLHKANQYCNDWKMQEQKKIWFHPAEPVVKYHQKSSNSCSLSSLSSAFHSISDDRNVTALVNRIKD